ncbi:MAG TPA: type IV toxin-antitoxin system AbiEi family antitoxin domain-containing protein [Solirubrobacterales bacterium]|nr:type IV toxin-antitoxin system AbiEi family antitoxin domain-containing protein [Solirubrobacterales bacterium]
MHDRPDMRGLEATAYSQHGYFTTSQARERGLSSQLLSHYVRGNRFERVRRGLYRLPGFPRPEDDEMREKWMAVGAEKAVLSHQSALALLDLSDNIPNAVHLLLGRRYRGLRRPAGVVIHTRPDEEEVNTVWREGLRLTSPARTLVDVAGEIQPEQLEMAVRAGTRSRAAHGAGTRSRGTTARSPRRTERCPRGGDIVRYESAAAFRRSMSSAP